MVLEDQNQHRCTVEIIEDRRLAGWMAMLQREDRELRETGRQRDEIERGRKEEMRLREGNQKERDQKERKTTKKKNV